MHAANCGPSYQEKSTSRLQLSHWDSLVKEYFTSRATMKLTLWKENQQYEAKPFGKLNGYLLLLPRSWS